MASTSGCTEVEAQIEYERNRPCFNGHSMVSVPVKKKDSRCRGWFFTFNNYTENDIELVKGFIEANCVYGIFEKEIGKVCGTPHLQGHFTLKNPKSWGAIMALVPFSFVEARRSVKYSDLYCTKDKSDVWSFGSQPKQGNRTDIETVRELVKSGANMRDIADICTTVGQLAFAEKLRNIYSESRNWEVDVMWLYGASGTGKTRYASEQAPLAWWSGKNLRWWDGYDRHEDIIIDDFRGDFCTLHELLRITDRYPYPIEVKGSTRQLLCRRIFITAPYHPEKVYRNSGENLKQLARRLKYRVFYFDEDFDGPREEAWDGCTKVGAQKWLK